MRTRDQKVICAGRRVAVMQPYLFPYFPYIQLLACVDVFVIFDTAQFISRGWTNRNLIEIDGQQHRFVVPVRKSPRNTPFSEVVFAENVDVVLRQLSETIRHANRKSPFPAEPQRLLAAAFPDAQSAFTPFVDAFERMCVDLMETLRFRTRLVRASTIMPRGHLPAEDYIMSVTKAIGGSEYVNPIGGVELYDKAKFARQGLELSFLRSAFASGGAQDGLSGLQSSVLDVLARHEPSILHRRLTDFVLGDACDPA